MVIQASDKYLSDVNGLNTSFPSLVKHLPPLKNLPPDFACLFQVLTAITGAECDGNAEDLAETVARFTVFQHLTTLHGLVPKNSNDIHHRKERMFANVVKMQRPKWRDLVQKCPNPQTYEEHAHVLNSLINDGRVRKHDDKTFEAIIEENPQTD